MLMMVGYSDDGCDDEGKFDYNRCRNIFFSTYDKRDKPTQDLSAGSVEKLS